MTTRTIIGLPLSHTKNATDYDNDFVEPTTSSLAFGSTDLPASITTATSSIALGSSAFVDGTGTTSNQIAIGFKAHAYNAVTNDTNAIGIGANCNARDRWNFCIGYNTRGRHDTVAIGGEARNPTGDRRNVQIGYGCQAALYCAAMGHKANARTNQQWIVGGYALGHSSALGSNREVVMGSNSSAAYRGGMIIVGHNAVCSNDAFTLTGNRGILFGRQATTTIAGALESVALGYRASTTVANQLAINVSGTTTNSFESTFTVSTAGTGVTPNPNTTQKVLPVTFGATNFVIQLYS